MINDIFDSGKFYLASELKSDAVTVDIVAASKKYTMEDQKNLGTLFQSGRLTVIDRDDTDNLISCAFSKCEANGTLNGFNRYTLTIRKAADGSTYMVGLANTDDGTNATANVIAGNKTDVFPLPADSLCLVAVGSAEYRELLNSMVAATISETSTAGEPIDSSAGNLGVSFRDDKYYKYSKFTKAITAVADNGSGKAEFTSAGHGFSNGKYLVLSGFSEGTYNVVGVIANVTTNTFDVEAIDYVLDVSGSAGGFDNYQGVILAGQTIAKDDTFTMYNLKAIVSGFTGLTNGSYVYVEDGGSFTESESGTTTFAGISRGSTVVVGAERTPSADFASQAEAEAGTNETKVMNPLRTKQQHDSLLDETETLENKKLEDTCTIADHTDNTKEIEFDASAISASTKRKITMPDADVDLGDIGNAGGGGAMGTLTMGDPPTTVVTVTHNLGKIPKLIFISRSHGSNGDGSPSAEGGIVAGAGSITTRSATTMTISSLTATQFGIRFSAGACGRTHSWTVYG